MSLKIINSRLQPHFPVSNELRVDMVLYPTMKYDLNDYAKNLIVVEPRIAHSQNW